VALRLSASTISMNESEEKACLLAR
jgi:hypothetical protein